VVDVEVLHGVEVEVMDRELLVVELLVLAELLVLL